MESLSFEASRLLPASRCFSEGGESGSCCSLSVDPDDSCRVLLSLDPEWTCVPYHVSVRAQEIRKCFPQHLDGCPTEDMDEFDLVLNEVLARPATTSSFVGHLRELQSVCPDLDAMCEMLGLRVSWLELKRLLIVRAQTRSSSFSLLELVEEVRHSAR